MKNENKHYLLMAALVAAMMVDMSACSDDDANGDVADSTNNEDYACVGQAVGNFDSSEWFPGGELGTTLNTTASCYEM